MGAAREGRAFPAGDVTFLFTDVVQSTRQFQRYGAGYVAALQRVQDSIRHAVDEAEGVVVRTEGDSTFAAFDLVTGGVAAARAAQSALGRMQPRSGEPALAVRAGLHVGAAWPVQNDYIALAVHVAARISSAAGAGQLLASDDVVTVGGVTDGVDLGRYELRDVHEPVRLWRLAGPDDPPSATPEVRSNVQRPHSSLVGRETELAELHELLESARMVTVVGAGGLGKTRLVSEYALRHTGDNDGGIWLVELAALPAGADIADAVLTTLGARSTGDPLSAVAERLTRSGPSVLVLDNCEHVIDSAATYAEEILRRAGDIRVITTSREPLEVPGERLLRLRPLGGAADGTEHATRLFRQRAADAGSELAAEDAGVVDRICRALDGVPLAIELAARRVGAMPLTALADDLEAGVDVGLSVRGGAPRQRSLESLIHWSFNALSADLQHDAQRLSVFPGRFTDRDARVLLRHRSEQQSSAAELSRRGLLDLDGDRYRMLFSVRWPIAQMLAGMDARRADAERSFVEWAEQRFELSRREAPDDPIPGLLADRVNLEAALLVALRDGLAAPGALGALRRIWVSEGTAPPAPLRERLIDLLNARPLPQDHDAIRMVVTALRIMSGAATWQFNPLEFDEQRRLLAAAKATGDELVLLEARSIVGQVFATIGDREEGRQMLHAGVAAGEAFRAVGRLAGPLIDLGVSFHLEGRPTEALEWYRRAERVAIAEHDDENTAIALSNVGELLLDDGRPAEASDPLRRAIRAAGYRAALSAVPLALLAEALLRLGVEDGPSLRAQAEARIGEVAEHDASLRYYADRLSSIG